VWQQESERWYIPKWLDLQVCEIDKLMQVVLYFLFDLRRPKISILYSCNWPIIPHVNRMSLVWAYLIPSCSIISYGTVIFYLRPLSDEHSLDVKQGLLAPKFVVISFGLNLFLRIEGSIVDPCYETTEAPDRLSAPVVDALSSSPSLSLSLAHVVCVTAAIALSNFSFPECYLVLRLPVSSTCSFP
jgi:hypothetical protein